MGARLKRLMGWAIGIPVLAVAYLWAAFCVLIALGALAMGGVVLLWFMAHY